jgi:hypothetical protein
LSLGDVKNSNEEIVTSSFTTSLADNVLSIQTTEASYVGGTFHIELKSTSNADNGLEENQNFYFTVLLSCKSPYVTVNNLGQSWTNLQGSNKYEREVIFKTGGLNMSYITIDKPIYERSGDTDDCPSIIN